MAGFADWWVEYVNTLEADGIRVTADTALTYSSVWEAVNMIAADIACPPLRVYDVENDGDLMPNTSHPAHYLLNVEPNSLMSAYTLRETLQAHALLWGNGVAAIEYDQANRPIKLIPLLPDRTEIVLQRGQLFYLTHIKEDDNEQSEQLALPSNIVLHVAGLGFDGYRGYPLWQYAKNSWALGMGSERHSSRTLKNNAVPKVALKTDRMLTEEEADRLLLQWERKHGGENAGNTALAAGGLEITPLSTSNKDNQHLEQRRFQRLEVASWFMLPPSKLSDTDNVAYNSRESDERAYHSQTLRRWYKRWEAECIRKLLSNRDKRAGSRIFKHDTSSLLDSDTATKAATMAQLITSEVATRNEMRRWFNLPLSDDPIANELRNPNTRTDASGADTETEEEVPAEPEPQTQVEPEADTNAALRAHVRMLEDRWHALVDADVRKSRDAARKSRNFLNWCDKHREKSAAIIDQTIEPISESWTCLTSIPIESTPGVSWATASHDELLQIAGTCVGTDDLYDRVVEATETWHERITSYIPQV